MRCPDCGLGELVEYGNMKECPRCHFTTYFGESIRKISTEPDFDAMF